MRIDHFAYQRATRVAALGLALQFAIGLTLLLFALLGHDTASFHASVYALPGILVWLSLIVVFNQHKLERLEALETDELEQQRIAGGSAFESEGAAFHVAARRLDLMHTWLLPIMSWLLIIMLSGLAVLELLWFSSLDNPDAADTVGDFEVMAPAARGWALGVYLLFAVASFIFSRFVAGMSKQPAWQNLRGGAGYMVGNAIVIAAVATGITFTYFEKLAVIEWISKGILVFMLVIAAEVVLNFILNLYRPRRAGEVPRPAFDSRLLSMLSAPDSIVRSINEAINYQFGFDIASSWGYQLLLRAAWKLGAVAVVVLLLLNSIVIVEPHQQAVRLRGGRIVGDVQEAGLLLKLPWPIETAEVHDVARVRELPLTAKRKDMPNTENDPVLWPDMFPQQNLGIEPFLVRTTQQAGLEAERMRDEAAEADEAMDVLEETEEPAADEGAVAELAENNALIEGEFSLSYRIRPDGDEGLRKFLSFSSDHLARRQTLEMRERALKALALREMTEYLSRQDLDRVVSDLRVRMLGEMRDRIQAAFDAHETGVEVISVNNAWIRPAGEAAKEFERVAYNSVAEEKEVATAERGAAASMILTAGSEENADRIIALGAEWDRLFNDPDADQAAVEASQLALERAVMEGGGSAADIITTARVDLWSKVLLADQRLATFRGRLRPYHAGPEIYRQFLLMDTLASVLEPARKYFIGIDPNKFEYEIEMLEGDPMTFVDQEQSGATNGESQQ
jgi:regulator of protease activity HflC (stomatin/prohibitin superfamily)